MNNETFWEFNEHLLQIIIINIIMMFQNSATFPLNNVSYPEYHLKENWPFL